MFGTVEILLTLLFNILSQFTIVPGSNYFLVSYSAFLRALVCCGPGHPLNIYLGFACTCDELELGVGNLKENVGDYGKLVSPLPEESRMRCFMSITRCGGNGLNYPEGFTCLCIGKGV